MAGKLGELLVLIKADNQLTPELMTVNTSLAESERRHDAVARQSDRAQASTAAAMRRSRTAIRELAQGVGFLGSTFIGLGASMRDSNNEMEKATGNTLLMVGTLMSSMAAAAQFVQAISKIITALKALHIQQLITHALSGPRGWAILAGAAVVGATAYIGYNAMQSKVATADKKVATVQVNVNMDSRTLTQPIKRNIMLGQDQNFNTGFR